MFEERIRKTIICRLSNNEGCISDVSIEHCLRRTANVNV